MPKFSSAFLSLPFRKSQKAIASFLSFTTLALNLSMSPAIAGDPFRTQKPHNIGPKTEAAFKAMFQDGNYKLAKDFLTQAVSTESNEPLVYAMLASLSYMTNDLSGLNNYATKTRKVAETLSQTDSLRGNIYIAVSIFLEGSYFLAKEGSVTGGTKALGKLREVFQYLDNAEKIDANDPELNLLKGYMDLLLATNLPFSNPSDAISRLQDKGKPNYLSNRGIAIGYRDLKQYDQALQYVEKALGETPNNPEISFLKAQILVNQGRDLQETGEKNKDNNRLMQAQNLFQQAQKTFQIATAKSKQLPKNLVKDMSFEMCRNDTRINNKLTIDDCRKIRTSLTNLAGEWGPDRIPSL